MPDQDLTSLDALKPDGQVEQVLTLDDAEHETRRKLKAWADVEHGLVDGGHTIFVSAGMAPSTPTNWQLWFNSESGELLIYHDDLDRWVTVEQPTFNYLYNSSFSRFFDATYIPLGWNKYGNSTTGTVVPAGVGMADTHQKFGPYALVINSGNADLHAYQLVGKAGSTFGPPSYWQGRVVAFGCWVWTSTPNKVRLIVDATGTGVAGTSLYHPGDGTWRWLVAAFRIPTTPAMSYITPTLRVEGSSITAVFSGPTFVEGSWCPHVLPSGLFLRSELLHVGSASGAIDTIPGGTMFYGPQGGGSGAYYYNSALTPFDCFVSNMRAYITHGAGAGQSYTARLTVNGVDSNMACLISDTNTFNFDNANKVYAAAGNFLSLKVTGTGGANVSSVRGSFLVEEVPLAIT